jgi:hypothetical protein
MSNSVSERNLGAAGFEDDLSMTSAEPLSSELHAAELLVASSPITDHDEDRLLTTAGVRINDLLQMNSSATHMHQHRHYRDDSGATWNDVTTCSDMLDPDVPLTMSILDGNFITYDTSTSPTQQLQQCNQEMPQLEADAQHNAVNFAAEHRIFLKAALDLLTERDRQAPELGMMDPVVLKSGSLKKAGNHLTLSGLWNAKFVEIRRGMFSYYENALDAGHGELLRTDVPLRATSCHCRAVRLHATALNLVPGGAAIFELSSRHNNNAATAKRLLWMAKTKQERQVWMQTIQTAMVGGSVTRGDTTMDHKGRQSNTNSPRSPFRDDSRIYVKVRGILQGCKLKNEYLLGLRILADRERSLKVPVRWVAKHGLIDDESAAFREETVDVSVDQLWRDLQRDSVHINGELFRGDAAYGPERIAGALMREILKIGRKDGGKADIPESQALAYTRDILLSGNRTRSGGDSYFCVNTLCTNQDLIVIVPSANGIVEPVQIDIKEDESDVTAACQIVEKSGWIKTRNKSQKSWRKLFFVLSEGTLSYYQYALPRPHKLRGQIILTDAKMSVSREERDSSFDALHFLVSLAIEGGRERYMLFSTEEKLLDWTYALECTMKLKTGLDNTKRHTRRGSKAFVAAGQLLQQQQQQQPSKARVISQAAQSMKEHAESLGLDGSIVESRLAGFAKRSSSSILVTVRARTEYNICTVDPQGGDEDTWALIRATFLQSFRVTGGATGRILRGEEMVRLTVLNCLENEDESGYFNETDVNISPYSKRKTLRMFRGNNDELESVFGPPPSIDSSV